jgi:hypothetical protein
MSSFYIGYLPHAPSDLRKFLRRIIAGLASIAVALAIILVLAQQRFSPAFFEFTRVRDFAGILQTGPYPSLLVYEPNLQTSRRFLLSAVGKHGFTERIGELDGQSVRLRAKLIYRSEGAMLEVVPNTLTLSTSSYGTEAAPIHQNGHIITLVGEIVDTKCFLGLMNPGRSKVHRDCAARCISGGLPPALLVENGTSSELYLLTDPDGSALNPERIFQYVGEPVRILGTLVRAHQWHTVRVSHVQPIR